MAANYGEEYVGPVEAVDFNDNLVHLGRVDHVIGIGAVEWELGCCFTLFSIEEMKKSTKLITCLVCLTRNW